MVNFRWYNMSKITVSEIASLTSGSDTELTFATGASGSHATRLSIASGGNVGIGDTSPTKPLTLGTTTPVMLFDDQSSRTMEIRGPSTTHNPGIITTYASDLIFGTNSTEKMRIDTVGRLGVGVTTMAAKFVVQDSSLPKIESNYNNSKHLDMGNGGSGCGFAMTTGHFMTFNHQPYADRGTDTNLTERMRITDGGQLLVNATTGAVNSSSGRITAVNKGNMAAFHCAADSTSSRTGIVFTNPNGTVGSVTLSGSGTAFNTSSDYRLKENVSYSWDATKELKKLKPCKFNFKTEPSKTIEGFLAHEVSSVVPIAVTGEKDATEKYTDEDGKEKTKDVYQGIDQSKLVPLLVKTIQELEARVADLESK